MTWNGLLSRKTLRPGQVWKDRAGPVPACAQQGDRDWPDEVWAVQIGPGAERYVAQQGDLARYDLRRREVS